MKVQCSIAKCPCLFPGTLPADVCSPIVATLGNYGQTKSAKLEVNRYLRRPDFLLLLLAARQLKPGAFEGNPSWIRLPASGALAAALLLALAASDHFSDSSAFVIAAKAVVRNGPLEESPESFKATDGTELLVHDRKGDFLEVETSLGQKGWIHSGDVKLLAP